jgi:hypothetical protein
VCGLGSFRFDSATECELGLPVQAVTAMTAVQAAIQARAVRDTRTLCRVLRKNGRAACRDHFLISERCRLFLLSHSAYVLRRMVR